MLRLIIALALYAILFAPCRITAAERPKQCPCPPQAPPVRLACICGDSCACPAGVCPSRCPAVQASAPAVTYQLQLVSNGRRQWYQLVQVSGTAASDCPNGQCPLPRR